jgi:TolA-binding protein
MEANKDNSNPSTTNNSAGSPDLNGLMSGNSGELLKYLLSTGGAVLINYLMSIKPMQDKMEALTARVNEQEKQISEMEDQHNELIKQLNKKLKEQKVEKEKPEELESDTGEYFSIKKNKHLSRPKYRRYLDV